MHARRGLVRNLLALATALAWASSVSAQPATTLVVPFPPGGGAAYVAAQLAEALPVMLGEPVVTVHKPGDDGIAAVDEVARAEADGRTLLVGSTASMIFAPIALGRPPVDPVNEWMPIGIVGTVPRVIVVHPSLPARNLDELIRLARESPGGIACGTGDRLSQHAVRLFERQAGVRLACTHYDGTAALRADLLAGRRKLAFESGFLPELQAGRLRGLAVGSIGRMKALPNVPTASEAGLPGFEVTTWLALFAPKGTPPARAEQLAAALASALRQPTLVAALEARGYVVRPMTASQMRHYLERDVVLWRRAVQVSSDARTHDRAASAATR